jgi:hypothetical protein
VAITAIAQLSGPSFAAATASLSERLSTTLASRRCDIQSAIFSLLSAGRALP